MKQIELGPYLLADWDDARFDTDGGVASRIVQTINRPFEYNGVPSIGVRMTPMDPTSYKDVPVSTLRKIREPQKRLWLHHAVVEGIGYFPEDMLRYDCCQVDVLSDPLFVERGRLGEYRLPAGAQVMLVQISTTARPRWTGGRWASFRWSVTPKGTYRFDPNL
jgi:hypothetical protein